MAEDKRNPLKAGLEVDELAGGRGGGFGSRPYPVGKVAARNAGRKAEMEAQLSSPENLAKREARKKKFGFNKGGMIKGGQCREYGK